MFDITDIKLLKNNVRHYHLYCDKCGVDRGYHQKSRADTLCKKCTHQGKNPFNHNSEDFKQKMSIAKRGQVPWCKGKKMSPEFCQSVSAGRSKNCLHPKAKEHRSLRQRMSNLLNSKFYGRKIDKVIGTFRHFAFTVEELKEHLQSSFYPNPLTQEEMTWDNKGQWHIDHITPDSWFTYTSINDEGFKQSWSLSNLQPLWASENLSKGNRFVG